MTRGRRAAGAAMDADVLEYTRGCVERRYKDVLSDTTLDGTQKMDELRTNGRALDALDRMIAVAAAPSGDGATTPASTAKPGGRVRKSAAGSD